MLDLLPSECVLLVCSTLTMRDVTALAGTSKSLRSSTQVTAPSPCTGDLTYVHYPPLPTAECLDPRMIICGSSWLRQNGEKQSGSWLKGKAAAEIGSGTDTVSIACACWNPGQHLPTFDCLSSMPICHCQARLCFIYCAIAMSAVTSKSAISSFSSLNMMSHLVMHIM